MVTANSGALAAAGPVVGAGVPGLIMAGGGEGTRGAVLHDAKRAVPVAVDRRAPYHDVCVTGRARTNPAGLSHASGTPRAA